MKRANGGAFFLFAVLGSALRHQLAHPLLHLPRRFVRKCDRQDSAGVYPARYHVRNAIRNDPRFPCSSTREDQNRPSNRFDGLSLLRVQGAEANHARAEFKTMRRFRKLKARKVFPKMMILSRAFERFKKK